MRIALPILLAVVAVTLWIVMRNGASSAAGLLSSGTVEATDADLGFQLAGRVAEVLVAEGDAVVAGQELARLDTRVLDASLQAARAELAVAEARLRELQAGARPQEVATARAALDSAVRRAENARSEAERARTLFEGGAISRQALDQAETAMDIARAARDQAEQALALVREGPRAEAIAAQSALVEAARARVAHAQATLGNAVITAPFGGIVTLQHREPGEAVGAGAPVLTILDPEDRWVRVYVREDEIGRVHLGMSARIVSDTYRDRAYPGEVVHVGSEAEFTPRNVQTADERTRLVYPVRVRITGDADFELKPGVPADVTLLEPA
jgi:HlyD family secretion protein